MKIIRYQDPHHSIHFAAQQADGAARQIVGDIFGAYEVTTEPVQVKKLLAPSTRQPPAFIFTMKQQLR